MAKKHLKLIRNDQWLEPFEDAINGRHEYAIQKEAELTQKGKRTLSEFACGHEDF